MDLSTYSQNHIDVKITDGYEKTWRLTGFYGHPNRRKMCHSWTLLRRLAGLTRLPWVCIGDFNKILCDNDKCGGVDRNWKSMSEIREALDDCGLEDMGFIGLSFTWSNKREGNSMIMERIDRSFYNREYMGMFPYFSARHLDFWSSDHRPSVLEFSIGAHVIFF
ncbi:hypothetical protein Ddye_009115 [Dipteronia dyeriana]|uniref:Exo_endo_phos domain-containing protein n=1 Tax=Dipteronia dyeriana TaxID=168575 RepID=A0AAD9XBQ9_9ROSI|nr:hypothetical protein Ddye_009115 [Dipteronia dyeriana]